MEETKTSVSFFSQSQSFRDENDDDDDDVLLPNWVDTFNKATNGGAQYVFAKDVTLAGAKAFTRDLTHKQMIRYQQNQPKCDRNFYKIMVDDKSINLFYDIDMTPEIQNPVMLDQLVNEVIRITMLALKELYGIDNIEVSDFAIMDSSGEVRKPTGITTKMSLHIVLVNKVRFKTIIDMKYFVAFIFSDAAGFLKEKIDLHIDHGVYRKRGSLRIPGSTKRGQNRFLHIITDHAPLDCFLTFTDNDIEDEIRILDKPAKQNNKRKEDHILRTMQSEIAAKQLSNDDFFEHVINALPDTLATDYNTWVNTGIKLYTAGAPETHWIDFSKKCFASFDLQKAHEKWVSFKPYGRGNMGGLLRLLRDLGIDEAAEELTLYTVRYMGKFNNEIALGLSRLYGDNHVYSRGQWYFYNGSKWILDENQTNISRTIMTTFHSKLNGEIRSIGRLLEHLTNDIPRFNEENARLKNLISVKEKTQSGRINSDWHCLNVTFDQPSFASTLDSFHHLIAFENGVYNLDLDQFLESAREYRTTMSTKYHYIHPYDVPEQDVKELDDLLHQIFPDDHILNYMMRFFGSCLSGSVFEELIHFMTGLSSKQTGSNGKSTFISLLLLTFGDYASTGHASIITSKRESANGTNSALMSLKGKRLVTFQEIDNDNSINMSCIKGLTGNDEVTGRQLYKLQETFVPQWKLVVCANKLPPVSSDDGGTMRRLRNIPFESKFVEDIHDVKWSGMTNIFQIDYTLKTKLTRYRMPLMHRLIIGYNEYRRNGGLPAVMKIQSHTTRYFESNNAIFQFLRNSILPKNGFHVLLREIVHYLNTTAVTKNCQYTEDDIIETIRDSFNEMTVTQMSENDKRLIIMNYQRIDEY